MDVDARIRDLAALLHRAGKVLRPPIASKDVEAFERAIDARLPEDYRAFVTTVGNGGDIDCPSYGLMAMGEVPDDHHRRREEIVARMKKPFPLVENWVWENEASPDDDAIDEVEQGVLHLGTEGCGMYWVLVVRGQARGTVWMLSGEGAARCSPPLDFVAWLGKAVEAGGDWPTTVLGG